MLLRCLNTSHANDPPPSSSGQRLQRTSLHSPCEGPFCRAAPQGPRGVRVLTARAPWLSTGEGHPLSRLRRALGPGSSSGVSTTAFPGRSVHETVSHTLSLRHSRGEMAPPPHGSLVPVSGRGTDPGTGGASRSPWAVGSCPGCGCDTGKGGGMAGGGECCGIP